MARVQKKQKITQTKKDLVLDILALSRIMINNMDSKLLDKWELREYYEIEVRLMRSLREINYKL